MPRLALLSGANPKLVDKGPVVQLRSGSWEIESDARDTKFSVRLDNEIYPIYNTPEQDWQRRFHIVNTALIQILIDKPGKESHITVFAKWLST